MARCICREEGNDGTSNHSEYCGNIYMLPIKTRMVETYPCKNHEQNYLKAGWRVVSKA